MLICGKPLATPAGRPSVVLVVLVVAETCSLVRYRSTFLVISVVTDLPAWFSAFPLTRGNSKKENNRFTQTRASLPVAGYSRTNLLRSCIAEAQESSAISQIDHLWLIQLIKLSDSSLHLRTSSRSHFRFLFRSTDIFNNRVFCNDKYDQSHRNKKDNVHRGTEEWWNVMERTSCLFVSYYNVCVSF